LFQGTYSTPWGSYSQAAVQDQHYRLHTHSSHLGTHLAPGWGEAKRPTQNLTPTAGFEPVTSWLLVRERSQYTTMAPVHL
jgi:hypothetical protein